MSAPNPEDKSVRRSTRSDQVLDFSISRADIGALTALFLMALLLHRFRLFDVDLWFDEVAILFQTNFSYSGIWNFCKVENFPPLYPWIAKLWSDLIASGVVVRYLSAFIGALIPPVAYLLGRESGSRKFALFLGIAALLSVPLLYYAQVIRMYGLFVLLACCSYLGFIRALRTHQWRYWFLAALANLLAFYTFLFAVFFIAAEAIVLIWRFRLNGKRYIRPLLAHLPAFVLMSFWFFVLFHRYQVQQSYVAPHPSWKRLLDVWLFMGSGMCWFERPWLAVLLNLPLWVGFLLALQILKKRLLYGVSAAVFLLSFTLILVLSLVGSNLLVSRYLIFLVPLFWILVLAGWFEIGARSVKTFGIMLVTAVLILGSLLYYLNYLSVQDLFRSQVYPIERHDGHSFSKAAEFIREQIKNGEIIVHYSNRGVRSFTFFPFIYYHQRALPEYIYSIYPIAEHAGAQYLKPKDRIESLSRFHPLPAGIWVVTLLSVNVFNDPDIISEKIRKSWILKENLPRELYQKGYRQERVLHFGDVTLIHYLKSPTGVQLHISESNVK